MSNPSQPTTFVTSVSATLIPPVCAANTNATLPLPPVDASNTALTIQNNLGVALFVSIGTAASLPAGPQVFGCLRIEAGQTLLVQAAAAEATMIGLSAITPGNVRVARGTATPATVFAS